MPNLRTRITPRKESTKVKPQKPETKKSSAKEDLDWCNHLGKAMDALVTARSSLLRARAGMLQYNTPDTAHTYLDQANYFIDLAQNISRQGLQVAIVHWSKGWGKREKPPKAAAERLAAQA